jgi:uncharacterized protein YbjT (DUF2867 family)
VALSGQPTIAVLGASGLIGQALAEDLVRSGYPVRPVARRFTAAQRPAFGDQALEVAFVGLDAERLAGLLAGADIVLNCVGVLQDGPRDRTSEVHAGFVDRLVLALEAQPRPVLLLHLSIPGADQDDATGFSRSKRAAEARIAGSGLSYAILRPGFVIAPAAFGGGALIRALAALPVGLDAATERRPFAVTAIADIAATVKAAARLWPDAWPAAGVIWDVMSIEPTSVGDVVAAFRERFGGPRPWLRAPGWLMTLGAAAGDLAGWLGWSPPVRTTALKELRRGVAGDPTPWIAATGIAPLTLRETLDRLPATVQETWFGRLYLAKPLVVGLLALFWLASGAVALGPGHAAAVGALVARSLTPGAATALALSTALADIAIGAGIAVRRTCRAALVAGLTLATGYLVAASAFAPELWADPLGSLVKIGPVLALMIVALAILPSR